MTIEVKMEFAKETKRTFVFAADATADITGLYIQKTAFDGTTPPSTIIVTVKA